MKQKQKKDQQRRSVFKINTLPWRPWFYLPAERAWKQRHRQRRRLTLLNLVRDLRLAPWTIVDHRMQMMLLCFNSVQTFRSPVSTHTWYDSENLCLCFRLWFSTFKCHILSRFREMWCFNPLNPLKLSCTRNILDRNLRTSTQTGSENKPWPAELLVKDWKLMRELQVKLLWCQIVGRHDWVWENKFPTRCSL